MQRGEGSLRLLGGSRQMEREREHRSPLQHHQLLTASHPFAGASPRPNPK